jgi:hypothetical protein
VGSLWILSDAHIGNMLHASTGKEKPGGCGVAR